MLDIYSHFVDTFSMWLHWIVWFYWTYCPLFPLYNFQIWYFPLMEAAAMQSTMKRGVFSFLFNGTFLRYHWYGHSNLFSISSFQWATVTAFFFYQTASNKTGKLHTKDYLYQFLDWIIPIKSIFFFVFIFVFIFHFAYVNHMFMMRIDTNCMCCTLLTGKIFIH